MSLERPRLRMQSVDFGGHANHIPFPEHTARLISSLWTFALGGPLVMQRYLSLSRIFQHRKDSPARKRLGLKRPTRRLCHEHLEDRSLLAALWVTTDADSGDGSLRWAISEANNAGGPDTIEFASELADQTITLTSGELHITDDLTINGLGADKLTISGNSSNRIFLVDDGNPNTTIMVSISGLSLENGSTSGQGGAILNKEDLTVEDSTLADNSAYSGGGIFNWGRTLTVTNSTLADNSATLGGGIYNNSSTLTVTNSTLADNSAYSGGGIFNNSSTLTVTNSTLADNSATRNGGGIYNGYSSTLTVTNSTLANNSADDTGGGI
ncbi:MAG: hypothetical protein FJ276_20545, partial [Planctomycetes bacterium]|nr:hypothetical protein [Planctomycetota bacterium]